MIVGIGIDLVEIARIKAVYERHRERFVRRLLTDGEREYVLAHADPGPRMAGRWAAKEAVLKALGTGWARGIQWRDIEIRNERGGKPHIVLAGGALDVSRGQGITHVLISISHCRAYATASALAVGP